MTKILIIEDETILRTEVMAWLTLEDYEVFGAADGIEGVSKALQYQPDLIVCDITMPRLDGHGVLLELRANPATNAIPFIFVTARAAHEDIRAGMELGADDYIIKPFTRVELLGAIQSRLDKKAAFENKLQYEVNVLQNALAEEHERRMLKSKLVAMFSHDFRNPLSTIRSSNSLLREYMDKMDEDRQQTHFNRIDSAVLHLLQMLDDMLVVAQMETDNLEFNPKVMNIRQFFQVIVEEFQLIHGNTRQIIYDSSFDDDIQADPRLIRQIAINLISNAIKYSGQDSEIRVRLEPSNGHIVLTVQDQGIGIPPADQARMFESFQRASNVGNVAGTGLGLAIVKQAVDLHGCSIQIESELGQGTTVRVAIPAT